MTRIESYIDHTSLAPSLTIDGVQKLCREAAENNFFAVCLPPPFVNSAKKFLEGSKVKVATVVGFPFGYSSTSAKVAETRQAVLDGAHEIDMVCAIWAAKVNDFSFVEEDIRAVVEAASGRVVKVILETSLLTLEEKTKVCEAAVKAGAKFVKTSTGYSSSGATIEDVRLMKAAVKGKALVKASGGIRDQKTAIAMIEARADRLGTSQSLAILRGGPGSDAY